MDMNLPISKPVKMQALPAGQFAYYRDRIDGETRYVFVRREDDAAADFRRLHHPDLFVACTHFGFIQLREDGSERARQFDPRGRATFFDRNFPVMVLDALPKLAEVAEDDPGARRDEIRRRALRKLTPEEIDALGL